MRRFDRASLHTGRRICWSGDLQLYRKDIAFLIARHIRRRISPRRDFHAGNEGSAFRSLVKPLVRCGSQVYSRPGFLHTAEAAIASAKERRRQTLRQNVRCFITPPVLRLLLSSQQHDLQGRLRNMDADRLARVSAGWWLAGVRGWRNDQVLLYGLWQQKRWLSRSAKRCSLTCVSIVLAPTVRCANGRRLRAPETGWDHQS